MELLLYVSVATCIFSLFYSNLVLATKHKELLFLRNKTISSPHLVRCNKNKNLYRKKYLHSTKKNEWNGYISNKKHELKTNDYEEVRGILLQELEKLKKENIEHVDSLNTFAGFLDKYITEVKNNKSCTAQNILDLFLQYNNCFIKYKTFSFPNFHMYDKDFAKWCIDFWSPLIDKENSKFLGVKNIEKIVKWKNEGHNVFILGNHHIETDATIIKYFFNIHGFENISKNIIFIGGHKIRADPLSRPFTASTNILCVYSRKYIKNPPHLMEEKVAFNMKSLNTLQNLLKEGNKIIWFAPSGGRDRRSSDGTINISPFDPKIIKTFYVFSKKSKVKTHFVGLALHTYNLCQPPDSVDVDEIEKERTCSFSPVYLNLGEDIFDVYPNMTDEEICPNIYEYVKILYKEIGEYRK